MKSLKIIPLLDSIPKVNSYSNIGLNLEKIFKMNSLKNLIQTLKFKKQFHKQLTSESKNLIKINEEYDIFERENKEKKLEEEDQIDIFSLPISKSETKLKIKKHNIKSFFFHKKHIEGFDTNSLAYKYHPNFNSIYKNIPSVRIFKPISENTKNKKNNLFNLEIKSNFNISKNSKNIKNKSKENSIDNNKYLNTINSYKNFKYRKNLKKQKFKSRNSSHNTISNNSKTHKSIESISRFITEILIKEINKYKYKINSPDKLPNLLNQKPDEKNASTNSTEKNNKIKTIPFHFKNRAIDFTKMRSRKALLVKNSLYIPNFGYYEPKYNLVEKRQYDIFFNKKPETDKHRQKKNLLKKILTSYDVESNYQTIDNNKLNNDILRRYNLLK